MNKLMCIFAMALLAICAACDDTKTDDKDKVPPANESTEDVTNENESPLGNSTDTNSTNTTDTADSDRSTETTDGNTTDIKPSEGSENS